MSAEINQGSLTADWRRALQGPVAVLLGGRSAEREVSLQSGAAVVDGLRAQNIDAVAVDTGEAGWLSELIKNYRHCFIALHGVGGEDGTVQGALETAGISYTGSGVLASALAMDKVRSKKLWRGIGLPTPDFSLLNSQDDCLGLIEKWGQVIIKPACEGSSIGMSIASTQDELVKAYLAAKEFDRNVMAEKIITGAEFTVAVLADRTLPPIRLETDHVFYDYDAKYISNNTRYILPCGLSSDKESELRQLALKAFNSIGCSGWGRVDVMQNLQGEFYLLEVNTVPGMTSHSLVPMAAKADGQEFGPLVEEILRLSLLE